MSRSIPTTRRQCRRCRAHVLPVPGAGGTRCGVCGSRELRPLDGAPPATESAVQPGDAPVTDLSLEPRG